MANLFSSDGADEVQPQTPPAPDAPTIPTEGTYGIFAGGDAQDRQTFEQSERHPQAFEHFGAQDAQSPEQSRRSRGKHRAQGRRAAQAGESPTEAIGLSDAHPRGSHHVSGAARHTTGSGSHSTALSVIGTIGETLIVCAIICGLFIVWQLWWTSVQSQKTQNNLITAAESTSTWVNPKTDGDSYAIAAQQSPDTAPVSGEPSGTGSLLGEIYIPRFGSTWSRTIIEGTDKAQLSSGGLCHYVNSDLPGALGNFAVAGHRAGYGDPLGDIDKLQVGDSIVVRTSEYWYVYTFTSSELVLPDAIEVTYSVPHDADAQPTQRLITLTTCHPRLQRSTHRWIAYGELKYWAPVSDGIPEELASETGTVAGTSFDRTDTSTTSVTTNPTTLAAKLPDLGVVCFVLLTAYAVIWISAATAWRWPDIRARRDLARDEKSFSLFGWYVRLQPGPTPIRIVLTALLTLIIVVALFKWAFPWAATNIPYLQLSSGYVG